MSNTVFVCPSICPSSAPANFLCSSRYPTSTSIPSASLSNRGWSSITLHDSPTFGLFGRLSSTLTIRCRYSFFNRAANRFTVSLLPFILSSAVSRPRAVASLCRSVLLSPHHFRFEISNYCLRLRTSAQIPLQFRNIRQAINHHVFASTDRRYASPSAPLSRPRDIHARSGDTRQPSCRLDRRSATG